MYVKLENGLFVIDPEGYELLAVQAAIKATEGADEIPNTSGEHHIKPTAANVIALWASDSDWSSPAAKRAFDLLVPLARRELIREK